MMNLVKEGQRAWDELPASSRQELERTLEQLPGELKGWKALVDRALEHMRWVAGSKSRIAIVGPANAGKSTLFNQLVRSKQDRAEVSARPGTTRQVKEADAGIFELVDTPGTDAVGGLGAEERELALAAAIEADVVVLLFDASHGIRQSELELFDTLMNTDKPMVVALNKIDLVKGEEGSIIAAAATTLDLGNDQILPLSALHGHGVSELLSLVVRIEPEIVAALGRALPGYRGALAQAVVARAAGASAAVALTPLPFLDFFPLIGIQASMVLAIARIHSFKLTFARARELLAAFGAGVLGRTLFYELGKLGGPPGWLLSAAVAAGTTAALGTAASAWFERGDIPSKEEVGTWAREFSLRIRKRLTQLGKRKPRKLELREAVSHELSPE